VCVCHAESLSKWHRHSHRATVATDSVAQVATVSLHLAAILQWFSLAIQIQIRKPPCLLLSPRGWLSQLFYCVINYSNVNIISRRQAADRDKDAALLPTAYVPSVFARYTLLIIRGRRLTHTLPSAHTQIWYVAYPRISWLLFSYLIRRLSPADMAHWLGITMNKL